MKILLLPISLLIFLGSCSITDEDSPAPQNLYLKYFGQGTNEAVDMVVTNDQNVVILASRLQSANDQDFYLIKTDSAGNLLKEVTVNIGGIEITNDFPTRIKKYGDDFLLIGYIRSQDSETGASLFTGAWTILQSDYFDAATPPELNFNFIDSVVTTDIVAVTNSPNEEDPNVPKFVVLGHSELTFAGDPLGAANLDAGNQIYLNKMDATGNTYWPSPKSSGFVGDETSLAIFENTDRSLLIIGETEATTAQYGGTNVYILNTNSLGTVDGSGARIGVQGGVADDVPYAVLKTALGYSIVGETTANGGMAGFHISISPRGEVQNKHVLQTSLGDASTFRALGVGRSAYNELMVVGEIPNFTEGTTDGGAGRIKQGEIAIMRVLPQDGKIDGYDYNYGTSIGNDRGVTVRGLPDGDMLLLATVDFGSGNSMVGLMRLNRRGELRD